MKDKARYKTRIIPVRCNKSDMEHLANCNKKSAEVWNLCVKLDKEHSEETGKFLGRTELQKLTKKCVEGLSAKNIQHVAHKYLFARDGGFESIKAKHENSNKVKLPYKEKRYFPTGWDYQVAKADYKRCIIKLGRAKVFNEDKQKFINQKPIICKAKSIPENIVEIELIYRNGYSLAIKYKEFTEYPQIQSKNEASIDLGEIHGITSIDNNGNGLIITSRLLRSIYRLRNKEYGRLRSRMSKCQRHSRQWWKYKKAIERLYNKTYNKTNDCIHKMSKMFLDYCIMNQVSTVYYGDLDSATRSTRQKKKGSKKLRQKLTQWNFGQLVKELENKLSRYGIKMVKVKEYYTSQKCPSCSSLTKPKNRNYVCRECGYTQHRDMVGAINILNDNGGFKIERYNELKYLRIR